MWLIAASALALAGPSQRKQARFFDDRVAPILTRNCLTCHNHELDDAGISFENGTTLLSERKGGGPVVVPGKPEKSALIRAIQHDGEVQMPPGKKLSSQEILVLTEWVKRGAPWGTKLRAASPSP